MADDVTDDFLRDRDVDPVLATDLARLHSIRDRNEETSLWDKVKSFDTAAQKWYEHLPKNIGLGAYRAALNAVDTLGDVALDTGPVALAGKAVRAVTGGEAKTSLRDFAPEFYDAAYAFADDASANNNLSDDITQSVAQFAIPFAAWMKGLGAAGMVGNFTKGLAAEAVTSATAFEPDEGRIADLVVQGRQAEGKYGDVIRAIAPDNRLVNAYLNYITAREGDTKWEGRFKNAVDNTVGSLVVAGILKGAAVGFRSGRRALSSAEKPAPAVVE